MWALTMGEGALRLGSSKRGAEDAQQRRKALLKAALKLPSVNGNGGADDDDGASSGSSNNQRGGNGKDFVLDCYCECERTSGRKKE